MYKRRADLEVHGLDAVWLELQVKHTRILVCGFYKPPNNNLDYFHFLKESVDKACSPNITDIITGDFNFNMAPCTSNKMNDLILEYNNREYTLHQNTHRLYWI